MSWSSAAYIPWISSQGGGGIVMGWRLGDKGRGEGHECWVVVFLVCIAGLS
jgi:hypothetical protein